MKLPHYIIVAVGLLGTTAPEIGKAFPQLAPYMSLLAQVCTLVVGALGLVSGSMLEKQS